MAPLILGLGSNLGSSEATLRWAIGELRRFLGPSLGELRIASLYRSAPVSPIAQPDFLNTVLLAGPPPSRPEPALPGPRQMLAFAKSLEAVAGRRPGPRYGPRTLDVDLLLYGEQRVEQDDLTLPHPRLRERRFVLVPIAEIAPGLPLPPHGRTAAELLGDLGVEQRLERLDWDGGPP